VELSDDWRFRLVEPFFFYKKIQSNGSILFIFPIGEHRSCIRQENNEKKNTKRNDVFKELFRRLLLSGFL